MYIAEWQWDDGNVEHMAERSVGPADVEAVWLGAPKFRRNKKGRSATHQMVGPGVGGEFIAAFIKPVDTDVGLWRTITARRATAPEIAWWEKS